MHSLLFYVTAIYICTFPLYNTTSYQLSDKSGKTKGLAMSSTQARLGAAVRYPHYEQAPGFWVITTYFNPCRYKSRRQNYDIFASSLRTAGIPLLTVECAFGDDDFELPETLDTVRVRSKSVMWQKERLLNLAASWLPASCTGVGWLDCDILFMNARWAVDTMRLLKQHAVVQLFQTAVRLEQGNIYGAQPDRVESFGAVAPNRLHLLSCGRYDQHGHTGYGWAMRREIFDAVGLYEHAIYGSADHFMAHAIYGDMDGFCIHNVLAKSPYQYQCLKEWSEKFHTLVAGSFTAVPGEIVHLWHGELSNRRYFQRMLEVNALGFNPYTDVVSLPGKPLEWHPQMNNKGLRDYFVEYFKIRREDG